MPGGDVDRGHDRLDERNQHLAAGCLDGQQVLRGQVVDAGDEADLHAVADGVEADQLVVVPGVFFVRQLFGVLARPRGSP